MYCQLRRWLAASTCQLAVDGKDLRRAIREATLSGKLIPVLCGAALRDLGIQPVLDAICDYLPSPLDRPPARGMDPATGKPCSRPLTPEAPFSALVFKVVATSSTDFLWLRVYSGSLSTEERCYQLDQGPASAGGFSPAR
jgi:elongation factor G